MFRGFLALALGILVPDRLASAQDRWLLLAVTSFEPKAREIAVELDAAVLVKQLRLVARGGAITLTSVVVGYRDGHTHTEDRRIKDGEATPACAGACPTQAIVFGDLNDPESRVHRLRSSPLNYGMLAELNVRPRTRYLARVTNPHPGLAQEHDGPAHPQERGHGQT